MLRRILDDRVSGNTTSTQRPACPARQRRRRGPVHLPGAPHLALRIMGNLFWPNHRVQTYHDPEHTHVHRQPGLLQSQGPRRRCRAITHACDLLLVGSVIYPLCPCTQFYKTRLPERRPALCQRARRRYSGRERLLGVTALIRVLGSGMMRACQGANQGFCVVGALIAAGVVVQQRPYGAPAAGRRGRRGCHAGHQRRAQHAERTQECACAQAVMRDWQ